MNRRDTSRAVMSTAVILTLFIWIGGSALEAAGSEKHLPQQDIQNAIETEYLIDDAVESHLIDVTLNEGVVTLSGTVNNLLEKQRAARIAETVKGVRAVVNRIEVRPVTRSDAQVRRDVYDALASDPATESYEVDVKAKDGIVTLSGDVDSWAEKELAAEVAKAVKGVKEVENEIDFEYTWDRPDSEIEEEVARRLESNVWVDSDPITVEVADGEVELSGTVGSAFERRKVRRSSWVSGVRSVDAEDVEVQWWAEDKMQREEVLPQKTDSEIERAVKDAFLYDPRLASHKVSVDSEDGMVTLTGTVDNLKAKGAAEQDTRNTLGVWRVKNLVKVRPIVTRSDEEMAEEIRAALERDPYLELLDISVNVINGKAYLYGDVNFLFERHRAQEIAARVAGVIDVDNYIEVEEMGAVELTSDWEIKEDIESQLEWSPLVESEQVNVAVRDGVATLTGTVDSWTEYKMAETNAREGGARRVINNLRWVP